MLNEVAQQREAASEAMDFEQAAALHKQWERVKAAATLADWIVRPVPNLRAIIIQKSAPNRESVDNPENSAEGSAQQAALFLLEAGCLIGPERLSTLGVRAVREQTSVGSSLFAQPLMLQAIPLEAEPGAAISPASPTSSPEERAAHAVAALEQKTGKPGDLALLSDHLSLFRRWYFRPEKQRNGEFFLPNDDGTWPIRRILRGAARLAIGDPKPMAETNREAAPTAAKDIKTRILHEGRPDVERTVPVVPKNP